MIMLGSANNGDKRELGSRNCAIYMFASEWKNLPTILTDLLIAEEGCRRDFSPGD